jgi:hypothetical protein
MLIEFTKFIWEDIGVWNEIVMLLAESLLHSYDIETEPIFSGNFMTLREMVDFLVFIKPLIEVTFAAG